MLKVLSGDTEFLFNIRGKHAKYQVAATYLHRYFEDAKVPERFTMHSFRHYHATELLLNKIGVKEVSKRLGHSDIQTTLNLYAHWIPEMDTEAARVIDDSYI
ncbi:tyrosine-type recombinase/integrase [Pectinatus frisingensis]|uniref:tyrosine-type recombinase/integrase n=1 Tax=Pectinatus frisingensis TaxID=865 RepID=UPI0018C456BC